jgi:hypothetical protein
MQSAEKLGQMRVLLQGIGMSFYRPMNPQKLGRRPEKKKKNSRPRRAEIFR